MHVVFCFNLQGVCCLQAFTLFATHFLELCQLQSLYPSVENQHMEVQHTRSADTGTERVVYTYLLNRGCSEERHYGTESLKSKWDFVEIGYVKCIQYCFALLGLRAAEMTALPTSLIEEAKIIASNVSQQLLVCFTQLWICLFVVLTFSLSLYVHIDCMQVKQALI